MDSLLPPVPWRVRSPVLCRHHVVVLDFPITRPASLAALTGFGDSRRKVWLPMPNA